MCSARLVVALALFVFAGCGPGAPPPPSTMTIGPEGGTVEIEGAILTVPPGALSEPTEITVAQREIAAPDGIQAYSPIFEFSPDGLTFSLPATIELLFDGDPSRAAVYWSTSGGGYSALESTVSGDRVSAMVSHFSSGFAGAPDTATQDGGVSSDAGSDAGATRTCTPEPWDGPYPFPIALYGSAVVGDVDGDGDQDVAIVMAYANQVQIVKNDGAGSFTADDPMSVGLNPTFIQLALVDADTHLDLVVLEDNQDQVSVYPGHGDGSFGAGVVRSGFSGNLVGLVVRDLDGDGNLDLMSLFQGISSGYAFQALGRGDGTFDAPVIVPSLGPYLLTPHDVDIDGDGDTDLVYPQGAGEIGVAKNDGAGNFTAGSAAVTFAANGIHDLLIADVDGDGKLDAVVSGQRSDGSNTAAVLYGDGAGGFANEQLIPIERTATSITAGDVSRDGNVDLFFGVVGASGNRGLITVLGAGSRTFGAPVFVESSENHAPADLFTGDFNGDGDLDVGAIIRDLVLANHSIDFYFGCVR